MFGKLKTRLKNWGAYIELNRLMRFVERRRDENASNGYNNRMNEDMVIIARIAEAMRKFK